MPLSRSHTTGAKKQARQDRRAWGSTTEPAGSGLLKGCRAGSGMVADPSGAQGSREAGKAGADQGPVGLGAQPCPWWAWKQ